MATNPGTLMTSIQNIETQLPHTNGIAYRNQLENALYVINQNLIQLDRSGVDDENLDQRIVGYKQLLQRFHAFLLHGLRSQAQLFVICNEIKDLLQYFAKFNTHGLDILCKLIETKSFNKLASYIEKYQNSSHIDNLKGIGISGYVLNLEHVTQTNLEANLNLNLNELRIERCEKPVFTFSRVLPVLAGLFTGLSCFMVNSMDPVLTGGLILTGISCGYFLGLKLDGANKEKVDIPDLQARMNAVTDVFPKLEESNEALLIQCQNYSETNQEIRLGMGKLFKGWELAKKALRDSRNDPSLKHHSEERLVEMVKNIGGATNEIEIHYGLSRDLTWSMIEFLNTIEI